jgi:hypothetical protein
MCLTVKEGCKIEIAEKDITTYKYVNSYENYWCGIFYSYPRFLYNEIQKAKYSDLEIELCLLLDNDEINAYTELKHLQGEKCGDEIIIDEGFHSYVNRCTINTDTKQNICRIPEGSEYCFGEDNDIVSNQIIVFKTIGDYEKYISSKISSN